MLGVYDNTTKEMQFLPFRDVFPRMQIEEIEEDESRKSPLSTPSVHMTKFSSKAKRRRHDERTSSAQLVRHNTNQVVDHAQDGDISQLLIDQKGTETDLRSGDGIRPHPNVEATLPEDLYHWAGLIPEDILTALLPVADEVGEASDEAFEEWKKKKIFCQYVLKLLRVLPKDTADRRTRISKIIFINHLFFMYTKPAKPLPNRGMYSCTNN